MIAEPKKLSLDEWDARYAALRAEGLREPAYGGPLRRHVADGDTRLLRLRMDDSAASLRLWNFLLSEEDRLHEAVRSGKRLVGTMKDLGTVPVMAFALPNLVAFYPDGAWWIPCIMERNTRLMEIADSLGIDDSFCPVRAMLGAFVLAAEQAKEQAKGTVPFSSNENRDSPQNENRNSPQCESHFPMPGLLISSAGAVCDDLSAIVQRLAAMGHAILWWEMPHRRPPDAGETGVRLPGGFVAPQCQVDCVAAELARVKAALEEFAGQDLTDSMLAAGIVRANRVRRLLTELRTVNFCAAAGPLPALEMLIAEMLAIHFCSDQEEAACVLEDLLAESRRRVAAGVGVVGRDAVRIYWVNPVADLRAMNLLEASGGRICGTEYLFCHALCPIPEDVPPLEALARSALADPMVGSATERANYICGEIEQFGAEAVIVSRIPGASHCGLEGEMIAARVRARLGLPVLEIEVPTITDAVEPALRTRLEALVETVRNRRE